MRGGNHSQRPDHRVPTAAVIALLTFIALGVIWSVIVLVCL